MTATPPTPTRRAPASALGAATRMELRKTTTTRLWWVLLLVMAALVGGITTLASLALTTRSTAPVIGDLVRLYGAAADAGCLFPLILGALAVTTEYRHQGVVTTFLAFPRRHQVVAAKALVQAGLALVFGTAATVLCVAVGATILTARGVDAHLGDPAVLRALAGGLAVFPLWALVGVGFGAIVRNQVVALVTLLAWMFLVEGLVGAGLRAFDALAAVASYLPGNATVALAAGGTPTASAPGALSPPAAAVVMLTYGVAFTLAGTWAIRRRDPS